MLYTRTLLALCFTVSAAALLSGCGGGGGGGSAPNNGGNTTSNVSSVFGKIVDTSGSAVPSAIVDLDGQTATATFVQGGYEIDNVKPGFHVVTVSTSVNGVTYTGATDVGVPSVSTRITNANVIVAPANEQAAVGGFVTDANGRPVAGARVLFETAFAASPGVGPSAPPSTTAIVAYTASNGEYQIGGENVNGSSVAEPGLPVVQGSSHSPRTYTITASSLPVNNATYRNATTVTQTFTAGESLVPNTSGSGGLNFQLQNSASNTGLTPNINFVQALTQPDLQAVYTPQVNPAAVAAAIQNVRVRVSPEYAQWLANKHAAAQIKRVTTAAIPHATASNYTVEMDVFFSLPGDTGGSLNPNRSELAGFNIYNDAPRTNNNLNQMTLYDVLIDPLANYWADPDLAAGTATYSVDTQYDFAVQSVANDGSTGLGTSASVPATPLSFVNLSQPADPNDQNGQVTQLAADPTFQWSAVDPNQPSVSNNRVANYYVFVYSSFPGVSTTPLYASSALPGNVDSFTLPSNVPLTAGTTYYLVVAATSTNNPTNSANGQVESSAVSISQINPFTVQ